MERQLEETVQGAASGIDGGDARRSQHHVFFLRGLADVFQEGRLTCSCFSRKEYGLAGILDELQCILELGVGGIYFDRWLCHSGYFLFLCFAKLGKKEGEI